MKKKLRNITVQEVPFVYWYQEQYDDSYEVLANQIILSPRDNKNCRASVTFTYDKDSASIVESPFIDLNTLTLLYSKDNKEVEKQKMPIIYYDMAHIFSITAKRDGEQATFDWGKPKAISEIIGYLLDSKKWDIQISKTVSFDGWLCLSEMGYSDIIPVISWSW